MNRPCLPVLRLFQLISPNLPVGAFTYSQGMEWAVECGWLRNADEIKHWLQAILYDSLQYLELPVLLRLCNAVADQNQYKFNYWSQFLYASRDTYELRNEEKQRARALYKLLKNLPDTHNWLEIHVWRQALLKSQLASYALAASHWQIHQGDLIQGYCWSWLENAVIAAVKLVPLGQTQGQLLLYELGNDISNVIQHASKVKTAEIGSSLPALAIASSLHETQYSRLFRS